MFLFVLGLGNNGLYSGTLSNDLMEVCGAVVSITEAIMLIFNIARSKFPLMIPSFIDKHSS